VIKHVFIGTLNIGYDNKTIGNIVVTLPANDNLM
jgi:hypothetical protein